MFHHEVLFKMNKKCEYHFRRACLLEAVDFAYKSSFNSDIFFFLMSFVRVCPHFAFTKR